MCGFVSYFGKNISNIDLKNNAEKISYRGPDSSSFVAFNNAALAFHRLSIVDVSSKGDQPFSANGAHLICNGEIYNHEKLKEEYEIKTESDSDCEVILHLYLKFGLEKTLNLLDGVYAFCIYDEAINTMFAARDPYGVRPAFFGTNKGGEDIFFSSEAKAISDLSDKVIQMPPGTWWYSDSPNVFTTHYKYEFTINENENEEYFLREIRRTLVQAVEKRLMSDREVGCLLSGGLDSSLIAALVCHMKKGYRLIDDEWVMVEALKDSAAVKTFSIGMDGSPDLEYAKKVAKHIDSDHNEVMLTKEEFLNSIEEVIYKIESYDTTTVRASVGNYLVSKYISLNSDCKVVFNGDGSDEVCCGYVYNINAPSDEELQAEAARLLKEIHMFDVLRSDRSISSNGLEPRTPFLDKAFVELYMSIPPAMKSFDKKNKIEKEMLRKAFEKDGLLPDDVLWRHKCAFSDGVSSIKDSWHTALKQHVESIITDDYFKERCEQIDHCKPLLKESLYYRDLFEEMYDNHTNIITHFWMPRWTNVIDPSARELDSYKE